MRVQVNTVNYQNKIFVGYRIMMKYKLIIIFSFLFISCHSKKGEVLDEFVELYKHIIVGETEYINDHITSKSHELLDELISLEKPTLVNILELGNKYKIKDFMFSYYWKYRKELDTNNTKESFYNFLAIEGVPLFNMHELYKVNTEKSRITPEIFIAIYKNQFGNKYLNWVKLAEENSIYKLDLLYTLELFNKEPKLLNDNAYKNWSKGTRIEFYEELVKMTNYNGLDHETIRSYRQRNIEILNKTVDNTR